jgi:uncharacterized membrane protein
VTIALAIDGVSFAQSRFFEVAPPPGAYPPPQHGPVLSADGHELTINYFLLNGDTMSSFWTIDDSLKPLILPITGEVSGLSADGSVLVGASFGGFATRWTSTGEKTIIPVPVGAVAHVASHDGTVVAGDSGESTSALEAFYWTAGSPPTFLGDLQGRSRTKGDLSVQSQAKTISADGSKIAGDSAAASGLEGFYWSKSTGMLSIGDLPGGLDQSFAEDISADGTTVVGDSWDAFGGQAIRWTQSTGIQLLSSGSNRSVAFAVSADGSQIVGLSGGAATLWDRNGHAQTLRSILEQHGLNLNGWQLTDASAISDNGNVIAGEGIDPSGKTVAWVAVIPEPTTLTLLANACFVMLLRRRH